MIALFSSVAQFFGLLGVFKYIMDQATVNAVHQMLIVLHELSKNGGPASLADADRRKLITEVGNRVWDRVVGPPETTLSTPSWIVKKSIPEGVRDVLGYATHPIALAYNKVSGKGKAMEGSAQERTRQIAVQGMWSFLLPACLAMTAACVLVREVEFVQVASELDYYSNEPVQASRIVKRIMLGGGRLSFSVPYNPLIMITAQILVGTTVFQLASLLAVILAHQPGNSPPMSPR